MGLALLFPIDGMPCVAGVEQPPLAAGWQAEGPILGDLLKPDIMEDPMSNLDFLKVNRNVATAPAAGASTNERPKAQVWANFGATFIMPDGNGGTENVFVSVFGVPVDTLDPVKPYTGKNERMRHITEAKALMLEMMQNAAAEMPSGEALPINGLEVELRRVGAVQSSAEGENPALEQIATRFKIGA